MSKSVELLRKQLAELKEQVDLAFKNNLLSADAYSRLQKKVIENELYLAILETEAKVLEKILNE